MVLYFKIINEITQQYFFVLKKFRAVPFLRSFNKINPQWYFISPSSMKKSAVLQSFIWIHSSTFYEEFQQNKSQVPLYFSNFSEINSQLLFVLNKFRTVHFMRSFNEINSQSYFIYAFPMKEINSSSLF